MQKNIMQAAKNNSYTWLAKTTGRITKFDLNVRDNKGNTAVMYAVRAFNVEVLKILLKLGGNPNIRGEHGMAPLHYAFMVGDKIPKNYHVLQILMENGANAKIENYYG